ncbi:MAG: HlyD family efflux transporter periplasmic adaptor subunit [Thiogranum sp.]|nr:HlyD family efflux transporter periplasmic adaptor subunit [Thiogranum sp.]
MTGHFANTSWYRLAGLRPRLAGHAGIQRQDFRGQPGFVLQNRISGRFYRLSASVYHFIALMDGTRTVQELLDATSSALGEDAMTEDQVVEVLGNLYSAEVLLTDSGSDIAELSARRDRHRRARWLGRIRNPLAIKLPLFDPDRLLERLLPLGRLLFSRFGAAMWLLVVGLGVALAAIHWNEISANTTSRLLSPQNLLLLGLCYPCIKALHELGHGLATRVWGGEVHETGVMLIALMPLPYVDASNASAFPEKHRRILVGAAGILVELFLAALGLLLWLNTQPGLVHSLAFNIMLIGSVSTLLFNGNPLLRFDGYYVLSDAIGIPNLAKRSSRYLGYLAQTCLFGVDNLVSPATSPGERRWLAGYGVLAFAYRLIILVVVILFVAETYPVIGLLIAFWATLTQIVMPILKHAKFILTAPRLERCRSRAVSVSAGLLLFAAVLLVAVPVPFATMAQGVVIPPDQSELRAGSDGVIIRFIAEPDSQVTKDQPLIETGDPLLKARLDVLEARLGELAIRHSTLQINREQVKADMLQEEIKLLRADIDRTRQQVDALLIRSPISGTFLIEQPEDMPGRFLRQGERLGYVADMEHPTVRVAVPQADIGVVRTMTKDVSVRLAKQLNVSIPASISRQVPAARDRLPSPVLGSMGGGSFAVEAEDPDGVRTPEGIFEIELTLPVETDYLGERVYVRFDHGSEPLARQWQRRLRQLFLSRFNV